MRALALTRPRAPLSVADALCCAVRASFSGGPTAGPIIGRWAHRIVATRSEGSAPCASARAERAAAQALKSRFDPSAFDDDDFEDVAPVQRAHLFARREPTPVPPLRFCMGNRGSVVPWFHFQRNEHTSTMRFAISAPLLTSLIEEHHFFWERGAENSKRIAHIHHTGAWG